MSYYYRDINGVEHTDKENSFTKAYEYNYFPFMEGPLYANTNTHYTPIIALKDGSKPVYTYNFIARHGGMPNNNEPFSHVYMATTTFKSKNNQYDLSRNGINNVAQLFHWTKCNNISIKEIYKNNEPIINYVDRTKGNMLSWTLKNDKEFYFSTYNYLQNGPHLYLGKDNKCLKIGDEWDNTANSATHGPFSSNVLIRNAESLLNIVRFSPDKQNDMFNYTETIKNYDGDYVMSYYTLDIDEIREKGNKLKLNYFYTILFDGQYDSTSTVTSISAPSNLSANWESNFTNTNNKSPFSFNYYISDESAWNRYGTAPTAPYSTGHNLTSTYGNTTATDKHEWKYISRFKNTPLDEWNVDTIKNFYVGNVNKQNQIAYSKFTNFKGAFYTFGTFNAIGNWSADVSAEYPQGSLVKYDNKTYIANWNINTYTAVAPTARKMNSAKPSEFDDKEDPRQMWIKVDIEEQNLDYSQYFGSSDSGHYLSANVNRWKDHSANIIPYVQTLNANCYYDRRHSMQNNIIDLTSYPSDGSYQSNSAEDVYNLKNRIWSENIERYFNDFTLYTKDADIVSYGGNNYTFKYNYSGAYNDAVRNCICFTVCGTQDNQYTAYLYVNNNGTTVDIGKIEELFNNNLYVTHKNDETWNRNTSYQQGTIVDYNGKLYQATVDVIDRDINDTIWNPSGYSVFGIENDITNPLYSFKLYKNYFCIGSATHTIDLTNETAKYIHIAFPVTPTLNSGLYDTYNGTAKTWITDLKMSYEAID